MSLFAWIPAKMKTVVQYQNVNYKKYDLFCDFLRICAHQWVIGVVELNRRCYARKADIITIAL